IGKRSHVADGLNLGSFVLFIFVGLLHARLLRMCTAQKAGEQEAEETSADATKAATDGTRIEHGWLSVFLPCFFRGRRFRSARSGMNHGFSLRARPTRSFRGEGRPACRRTLLLINN